jgi:outer membrane protein TolC
MSSRIAALLAGSILALSTAEARADDLEGPLTEARVVAMAAREAPSVIAAVHDADAAEAERTAVDRARLPDLVITGRYTRLSSIPSRFRTLSVPFPDGTEARFGIPQLLNSATARAAVVVPLTDAWLGLAANARALGHVATAKRIELEAAQARAAYEARAAFLLYRRSRGALRIAESAVAVAEAQEGDQKRRVSAGTAAPSTALTFEVAMNAAVARLRAAEADVAATEAGVRTFVPASLAAAPLVIDEGPGAPLSTGTMGTPPALRAAEAAARAADTRAEAETLAMLPRLSLVAGAEVSAPHPRAFAVTSLVGVPSWDVSVQLDWSLTAVTTGSARADRAVAEGAALRARAEEIRRQLHWQRTSALAARISAEARVAAGRASVATTTKLTEARQNELAAGAATPLDVTTAEAERVRARLELIDAELDLRLSEARIAFTSGYVP